MILQKIAADDYECPPTTCYCDHLCDHKGQPGPGVYRFSLEPVQYALDATRPIGYRGLDTLKRVLASPAYNRMTGYGLGGEVWLCLTCAEGIWDNKFWREVCGDTKAPNAVHELIQISECIVPEIRSIPGLPGRFNLTSPQRHTLELWIAVHRRAVFVCDPANSAAKKLLDEGADVREVFPSEFFSDDSGQAIYRDAETRDFRGRASNDQIAELMWDQVFCKKLSESMELSDQLVARVEREQGDRSPRQKKEEEEKEEEKKKVKVEEEEEEEKVREGKKEEKEKEKKEKNLKQVKEGKEEKGKEKEKGKKKKKEKDTNVSIDDDVNGKLFLALPSLSMLIRIQKDSDVEFMTAIRVSERAKAQKRQRRSANLNKLVEKGSSSKELALPALPNTGVQLQPSTSPPQGSTSQPQSSTSQPKPGVAFKLKFKSKAPLPRAQNAFSDATQVLKATKLSHESHDGELEKGGNNGLSDFEFVKKTRERDSMPVPPVRMTVNADRTPSSTTSQAACKGQKRDREGSPVTVAPAPDPDDAAEERRRKCAKPG